MIYLTLLNGTGYVFNVEDYMTLRQEHRIMGVIVGTCSNKGWSINDCAMPVALNRCETQLLVELGIARIVSKQSLLRDHTANEIADYNSRMESRIDQQQQFLKAEKLRETERNMDKILAGKRMKLLKDGVAECDIQLQSTVVLEKIASSLEFERDKALIDIPCSHPEPHESEVVRLASDVSLKYRVFRDLWQRGNFVTCGAAFGADFLIYPGDPLLYHASHIVILLPDGALNALTMITKVRLAVIVNKLCVFAYMHKTPATEASAETLQVRYQTVQWQANHST